jgi:hypothetical protein
MHGKHRKEQAAQRGAFASFKGTPQQAHDLKQPNSNSTNNHGPRPCICGKIELLKECPYLFEWNQPTNWKPDPKLQQMVQDRLERSSKTSSLQWAL